MKTSVFLSIFLGLSILLGVFWWWSSRPVLTYKTEPVTTGNIEAVVAAIGTVRPRDSVDVGVQVSGQITRLYVKTGDTVEKGQLLAEIDARVLQAAVDAGQAELAMLKAQLQERQAEVILAEQNQRRQVKLSDDGATSEEKAQTAQASLLVAQAKVKQLQAALQQTRSQLNADEATLSYSRIYAPMTGTVLTISVQEGQTLNANYQTPTLLQLADLSTMRIQASVSEADIHRIRPRIPVRFSTLGNTGRLWHSEVDQILPAPENSDIESSEELLAVAYTVLFDVDNSDGSLMPGMTAEVDFVVTFARDVSLAPIAALHPQPPDKSVYQAQVLLPGGFIEERQVTIGRRDRLRAEILDGLQLGEQLVTDTHRYLRRRDSW